MLFFFLHYLVLLKWTCLMFYVRLWRNIKYVMNWSFVARNKYILYSMFGMYFLKHTPDYALVYFILEMPEGGVSTPSKIQSRELYNTLYLAVKVCCFITWLVFPHSTFNFPTSTFSFDFGLSHFYFFVPLSNFLILLSKFIIWLSDFLFSTFQLLLFHFPTSSFWLSDFLVSTFRLPHSTFKFPTSSFHFKLSDFLMQLLPATFTFLTLICLTFNFPTSFCF